MIFFCNIGSAFLHTRLNFFSEVLLFLLKSKNSKYKVMLLIAAITASASNQAFAQLDTGEKYIQNRQTGKLIDVKDGSKTAGTQIWQYSINYTKSQAFNTYCTAGCDSYYIAPQLGGLKALYLTLKREQIKTTVTGEGGILRDRVTEASADPSVSDSRVSNYSITQDEKYRSRPSAQISARQPQMQLWKFIAVQGEPDTYIIQSTAFAERFVLQPTGMQSADVLTIAPYTGAEIQKWKVLKTVPATPTDLKLENFRWESNLLTGDVRWQDNANNETGYQIWVKRKEPNGSYTPTKKITDAPANSQYASIKDDNSGRGKGREHCFSVVANNQWGESSSSGGICGIPSTAVPTPPPPTGYSSVTITNCDDDNPSLRIWAKNSVDNIWVDKGILVSEWSKSAGRCNPVAPKTFTISTGRSHQIVAINCGSQSPSVAQSSCRKFTSAPILGKTGGVALYLPIN